MKGDGQRCGGREREHECGPLTRFSQLGGVLGHRLQFGQEASNGLEGLWGRKGQSWGLQGSCEPTGPARAQLIPGAPARAQAQLCLTWSRTDFSGSTVRPQSTGRILWAQSFIE